MFAGLIGVEPKGLAKVNHGIWNKSWNMQCCRLGCCQSGLALSAVVCESRFDNTGDIVDGVLNQFIPLPRGHVSWRDWEVDFILVVWDVLRISQFIRKREIQDRIIDDRLRFLGWVGRGIVVGSVIG